MKTAFFLPVRSGSERVKNKNTRTFAGNDKGLTGNKIAQLTATRRIDEIIVSTNDAACIEIARQYDDPRVRIVKRPEELCTSQTNLEDLIAYVPTVSDADVFVWGHVTTPFVDGATYDDAVLRYFAALSEGYDSLIGVREVHNFFLNKAGAVINNSSSLAWPRTQDLDPLFEVNHAVFIAARSVYEEKRNRVGDRPYLYRMNAFSSFDIDWEEDFVMAELLAPKLRSQP